MLNSKIAEHHLARQACIYIRQSSAAQVRFNQESTERQYNLANQAQSLGWTAEQIRFLDADLAHSAEQATKRDDFKSLVSDVAMGRVGAIFALESSRLARSNKDWYRLLELCAITKTLLFDGDGCYDPAEFNDSLYCAGRTSCEICSQARRVPEDQWRVVIPDHHPSYISSDQFLANRKRLAANRTNIEDQRIHSVTLVVVGNGIATFRQLSSDIVCHRDADAVSLAEAACSRIDLLLRFRPRAQKRPAAPGRDSYEMVHRTILDFRRSIDRQSSSDGLNFLGFIIRSGKGTPPKVAKQFPGQVSFAQSACKICR
jgi:Resolvase, N terminal domain